jgi:hypothetical protein
MNRMKKVLSIIICLLLGSEAFAEFHPNPYKVITKGRILFHKPVSDKVKPSDYGAGAYNNVHSSMVISYSNEIYVCNIMLSIYASSDGKYKCIKLKPSAEYEK